MLSAYPSYALLAVLLTTLSPFEVRGTFSPSRSAAPGLAAASSRVDQRKSTSAAHSAFPRAFRNLGGRKTTLSVEGAEDDEGKLGSGVIHRAGRSFLLFPLDHSAGFSGSARPRYVLGRGRWAAESSQHRFLTLCRLLF